MQTTAARVLSDAAVRQIVQGIEKNEIVLVLGPGVATTKAPDGKIKPLVSCLANELAKELDMETDADHDDLVLVATLFETKFNKQVLRKKVLDFYSAPRESAPILNDLVNLPFNLILNTTPDLLLSAAYKTNGLISSFEYYSIKKRQESILFEQDQGIPLIFNLFGSTIESASRVLPNRLNIKGMP